MRSKRPRPTGAPIDKVKVANREDHAGVPLRAAQMHGELEASTATAREQAAPYLGGLEHLIAAAYGPGLKEECISARNKLVVRYRELRRIGFMPPALEEFIHALGRDIFSREDPSAALRFLLGKHLKSGRPRDERRNVDIAARVRTYMYSGLSREEAIGQVSTEENPADSDNTHERQTRRIYEDNARQGKAVAWLKWLQDHPEDARDMTSNPASEVGPTSES